MVARDNETVRAANERARAERLQTGVTDLGWSVPLADGLTASQGAPSEPCLCAAALYDSSIGATSRRPGSVCRDGMQRLGARSPGLGLAGRRGA
jgi:hypothetical protein